MHNYLGGKYTCISTTDVYKTPIEKDSGIVHVYVKMYMCVYI